MFAISVQTRFRAHHAIRLPDGSLEPSHAHDWPVVVTVSAAELDAIDTVMDFHPLEAALRAAVADWHGGDLNRLPPFAAPDGRLLLSPTAERVAWCIAERLRPAIRAGARIESVRLEEAPGCFAEYRP